MTDAERRFESESRRLLELARRGPAAGVRDNPPVTTKPPPAARPSVAAVLGLED